MVWRSRLLECVSLCSRALCEGLRGLWLSLLYPLRFWILFTTPFPKRLRISPLDMRTADPTIAQDIYAGWFVLAGKAVNMHGHSPFDMSPHPPAFEKELEGFGWLCHLRAADTALARINSRAFVEDWMNAHARASRPLAWEEGVAAKRLLSFLTQAPLILSQSDPVFYRRFMKALHQHAVFLQYALRTYVKGEVRLFALIAYTHLILCAEGMERLLPLATKWLEKELKRQILPDGGHISRNPQKIADLLLDLIPLKNSYLNRWGMVPPSLQHTIDRMMPMLRLLRHPDGTLGLFNGAGATKMDELASILSQDDTNGQALKDAPWSGYQRIEVGRGLLLMDAGKPPPRSFSTTAHAGHLSFEFSFADQRLLVNCGVPQIDRPLLREMARTTAAHTTLGIDHLSSSRFANHTLCQRWFIGEILEGPDHVTFSRHQDVQGIWLEAMQDGYASRRGFLHHRRIFLAAPGTILEGEDSLSFVPKKSNIIPQKAQIYTIRFHLLPTTWVEWIQQEGEDVIRLVLPDGQIWEMRAFGAAPVVEESLYMGGIEGPRKSHQIVLSGPASTHTKVRWRFEKKEDVSAD